jgi:hypothetical protein
VFELILKQKKENSRNEKEITSFEFKNNPINKMLKIE